MRLIDTDAEGPPHPEEEPPRAIPPRPEHRRVAVSLLFTVAVLVGTVVAVFTIFPERHNQLVTSTLAAHRAPGTWEVVPADADELRAWATGVLGHDPPLPAAGPDLIATGARSLSILGRRAALVRYRVGAAPAAAEVTYLVQRARDMPHRRIRQRDGDDAVESWRDGPWTCVAIGPAAGADTWRQRLGVP